MVNDVDYTRISALALHDWSARAPVGPDGSSRLLVTESIPAGDTWGARFLRTVPSRPSIPSAKPGGQMPGQGGPPPRPAVLLASLPLGTPASRNRPCRRPLVQPASLM